MNFAELGRMAMDSLKSNGDGERSFLVSMCDKFSIEVKPEHTVDQLKDLLKEKTNELCT